MSQKSTHDRRPVLNVKRRRRPVGNTFSERIPQHKLNLARSWGQVLDGPGIAGNRPVGSEHGPLGRSEVGPVKQIEEFTWKLQGAPLTKMEREATRPDCRVASQVAIIALCG